MYRYHTSTLYYITVKLAWVKVPKNMVVKRLKNKQQIHIFYIITYCKARGELDLSI